MAEVILSPQIPPQWQVRWNQFEYHKIDPDPVLRFESLICLTLPPDFILDFGWYARDEGIRYDLQINRGHFGWDDVVVYESSYDRGAAIQMLQSWLDRLVASPAVQAADADLQSRLIRIEQRLHCVFIPPSGELIEEPLPNYLRRLILRSPSAWWESGSGDAALRYENRYGVNHGQLIFLLRDPHGVHIQYHPIAGDVMYCRGRPKPPADREIVICLGGAPLNLTGDRFIARSTAAQVLTAFIREATGDRPAIGTWRTA
jgi:hypothetical protein